jgi:hypothetical protein
VSEREQNVVVAIDEKCVCEDELEGEEEESLKTLFWLQVE